MNSISKFTTSGVRRFHLLAIALVVASGLGCTGSASAQQVVFDDSWQEQGFPRLDKNQYRLQGEVLGILAKDSVSVLFRRLSEEFWDKRKARWRWTVVQGVPPTNLKVKGGEDRNISIYFMFLPGKDAERLKSSSVRRILASKKTRTLQYVYGGAHPAGERFYSPYSKSAGMNIVLRTVGTGSHDEQVDLEADYVDAFGGEPEVLFGIGISSDSDDTDTEVRATVEGFFIE